MDRGQRGRIRQIDPSSRAEVEGVAARMRRTLVEVLGEERGTAMYDMDWLVQRVRWHLDPEASTAQIFLAEDADGEIQGHTIVRVEREEGANEVGLFSTTFVEPVARRSGLASALLREGEAWMIARGLPEAVTYTSDANVKLIGLYRKHGYGLSALPPEMVRLAKPLRG